MQRELIVDRSLGMTRTAVMEDGALCELHIQRDDETKQTGSIYLGRIQSIRPAVCAAFVDIGLDKNAFLPLLPNEKRACGEWLIVQGETAMPTVQKGLRVTHRVTLTGRLLVLVPGDSGVHVSRKIAEESVRRTLQDTCDALCPSGFALVVRTAAATASPQELVSEVNALISRWETIQKRADGMRSPDLLDAPEPLAVHTAHELADSSLTRIVTNDAALAELLTRERSEGRLPETTAVEHYDEQSRGVLLFDAFGLETQQRRALERRVWLPCGGYLIFDRCEAMTVVDVNSGKMTRGRDAEENAFRVDVEAADEIARQLRLRNIGGIVVVDFIDLADASHREALISRMREAASRDRSAVSVEGLTRLGLMEMTRRRRGEELLCALCTPSEGAKARFSPCETARMAMREVCRKALSGQEGPFLIRCGDACAEELSHFAAAVSAPVYALAAYAKGSDRFEIKQLVGGETPPQGAVLLR